MSPSGKLHIKNFLSLANSVIVVFILSLGPFILMGQIPQLFSRLFPFTRGLNHAYWAPNMWALITAADRVLLRYVKRTGADVVINLSGVASTSRGLVGDTIFAVLPTIKPIHTFVITILFHLLAAERHAYFRTFLIASVAGIFSLFPLIFTPGESIVKVLYSAAWMLLVYAPLSRRVYEFPKSLPYVILDGLEKIYLAGFPLLLAFVSLFPALVDRQRSSAEGSRLAEMEFLPLMLTSVYCAIGLNWGFLRLMFIYLHEETTYQGQLSGLG
ncbi:hypothetical protein DXG03_000040 [Asterophora parasitica]|uniref:Alpha-1,3-glucosyltransferase n=1 Tax=Asterophora parasitica TaxID=117018 RepID=A0A9P7GFI3_9AGAR|nr:hypothetical protein DXG03_000040 [Asterophora parasitica]